MPPRAEPGLVWRGRAPAKTNLFLRILAREESGYHQIESLFQTLSLADTVELERRPPEHGITLSISGVPENSLGPIDDNLMVRAARSYLAAAAPSVGPSGLRMTLDKVIPHGAGLGGGSSDAAAVLRGLQALFPGVLAPSQVLALGAAVGSDVPFFLAGGPLALVWGRGGRVLPLAPLPRCPVLILQPARRISTPAAYARLAAHRRATGLVEAGPRCLGGWSSWEEIAREADNDFEQALAPVYPELPVLRSFLADLGAHWSLLSGSGSAVVGFFPDGIPDPLPWERWDRHAGQMPRPDAHVAFTETA
jgi:4-diphosphocytidyl-2-C-methyl-D-erythritol kinase